MRVTEVVHSRLADTDEAYRQLLESDADWFVRNADDLRALRTHDKASALSRLGEEAFAQFVASCKFGKHGIAGGDSGILARELGLKGALSVFHQFGASTELALSWQEQGCDRGTCSYSFWDFCSHTSCHRIDGGDDQGDGQLARM